MCIYKGYLSNQIGRFGSKACETTGPLRATECPVSLYGIWMVQVHEKSAPVKGLGAMTRMLGARFVAQRGYNNKQGEKRRESVFHNVL